MAKPITAKAKLVLDIITNVKTGGKIQNIDKSLNSLVDGVTKWNQNLSNTKKVLTQVFEAADAATSRSQQVIRRRNAAGGSVASASSRFSTRASQFFKGERDPYKVLVGAATNYQGAITEATQRVGKLVDAHQQLTRVATNLEGKRGGAKQLQKIQQAQGRIDEQLKKQEKSLLNIQGKRRKILDLVKQSKDLQKSKISSIFGGTEGEKLTGTRFPSKEAPQRPKLTPLRTTSKPLPQSPKSGIQKAANVAKEGLVGVGQGAKFLGDKIRQGAQSLFTRLTDTSNYASEKIKESGDLVKASTEKYTITGPSLRDDLKNLRQKTQTVGNKFVAAIDKKRQQLQQAPPTITPTKPGGVIPTIKTVGGGSIGRQQKLVGNLPAFDQLVEDNMRILRAKEKGFQIDQGSISAATQRVRLAKEQSDAIRAVVSKRVGDNVSQELAQRMKLLESTKQQTDALIQGQSIIKRRGKVTQAQADLSLQRYKGFRKAREKAQKQHVADEQRVQQQIIGIEDAAWNKRAQLAQMAIIEDRRRAKQANDLARKRAQVAIKQTQYQVKKTEELRSSRLAAKGNARIKQVAQILRNRRELEDASLGRRMPPVRRAFLPQSAKRQQTPEKRVRREWETLIQSQRGAIQKGIEKTRAKAVADQEIAEALKRQQGITRRLLGFEEQRRKLVGGVSNAQRYKADILREQWKITKDRLDLEGKAALLAQVTTEPPRPNAYVGPVQLGQRLRGQPNIAEGIKGFAQQSKLIAPIAQKIRRAMLGGRGISGAPFGVDPKTIGRGSQAVIRLAQSMRGLQQTAGITGKLFGDFGNAIKQATIRLAAFAIGARLIFGFTNAIIGSVGKIKQFQQGLADVEKISVSLSTEIKKLAAEQLTLGVNTGRSIADIQAAATAFARQGRDMNEIIHGMRAATIGANAGFQSMKDAVDTITVAVNIFNKQFSEAERIVDVFSAIADTNAASVDEIRKAFQRAGSSAKAFGLTLEQLVALQAATIAETRLSGEQIGTAFKNILPRFVQNEKVLASLGVATRNVDGSFRDLFDVIVALSKRFKELSNAERVQLARRLVGIRQSGRLLAILQSTEKAQKNLTTATNAGGQASLKASRQQQTFNNLIQSTKNALFELIVNLTDAGALDFTKGLIRGIGDVVKTITSFEKSFGGISSTINSLITVLPGLFIINKIAKSVSAFRAVSTHVQALQKHLSAVGNKAAETVGRSTQLSGIYKQHAVLQAKNVAVLKEIENVQLTINTLTRANQLQQKRIVSTEKNHGAIGIARLNIHTKLTAQKIKQKILGAHAQITAKNLAIQQSARIRLIQQGVFKRLIEEKILTKQLATEIKIRIARQQQLKTTTGMLSKVSGITAALFVLPMLMQNADEGAKKIVDSLTQMGLAAAFLGPAIAKIEHVGIQRLAIGVAAVAASIALLDTVINQAINKPLQKSVQNLGAYGQVIESIKQFTHDQGLQREKISKIILQQSKQISQQSTLVKNSLVFALDSSKKQAMNTGKIVGAAIGGAMGFAIGGAIGVAAGVFLGGLAGSEIGGKIAQGDYQKQLIQGISFRNEKIKQLGKALQNLRKKQQAFDIAQSASTSVSLQIAQLNIDAILEQANARNIALDTVTAIQQAQGRLKQAVDPDVIQLQRKNLDLLIQRKKQIFNIVDGYFAQAEAAKKGSKEQEEALSSLQDFISGLDAAGQVRFVHQIQRLKKQRGQMRENVAVLRDMQRAISLVSQAFKKISGELQLKNKLGDIGIKIAEINAEFTTTDKLGQSLLTFATKFDQSVRRIEDIGVFVQDVELFNNENILASAQGIQSIDRALASLKVTYGQTAARLATLRTENISKKQVQAIIPITQQSINRVKTLSQVLSTLADRAAQVQAGPGFDFGDFLEASISYSGSSRMGAYRIRAETLVPGLDRVMQAIRGQLQLFGAEISNIVGESVVQNARRGSNIIQTFTGKVAKYQQLLKQAQKGHVRQERLRFFKVTQEDLARFQGAVRDIQTFLRIVGATLEKFGSLQDNLIGANEQLSQLAGGIQKLETTREILVSFGQTAKELVASFARASIQLQGISLRRFKEQGLSAFSSVKEELQDQQQLVRDLQSELESLYSQKTAQVADIIKLGEEGKGQDEIAKAEKALKVTETSIANNERILQLNEKNALLQHQLAKQRLETLNAIIQEIRQRAKNRAILRDELNLTRAKLDIEIELLNITNQKNQLQEMGAVNVRNRLNLLRAEFEQKQALIKQQAQLARQNQVRQVQQRGRRATTLQIDGQQLRVSLQGDKQRGILSAKEQLKKILQKRGPSTTLDIFGMNIQQEGPLGILDRQRAGVLQKFIKLQQEDVALMKQRLFRQGQVLPLLQLVNDTVNQINSVIRDEYLKALGKQVQLLKEKADFEQKIASAIEGTVGSSRTILDLQRQWGLATSNIFEQLQDTTGETANRNRISRLRSAGAREQGGAGEVLNRLNVRLQEQLQRSLSDNAPQAIGSIIRNTLDKIAQQQKNILSIRLENIKQLLDAESQAQRERIQNLQEISNARKQLGLEQIKLGAQGLAQQRSAFAATEFFAQTLAGIGGDLSKEQNRTALAQSQQFPALIGSLGTSTQQFIKTLQQFRGTQVRFGGQRVEDLIDALSQGGFGGAVSLEDLQREHIGVSQQIAESNKKIAELMKDLAELPQAINDLIDKQKQREQVDVNLKIDDINIDIDATGRLSAAIAEALERGISKDAIRDAFRGVAQLLDKPQGFFNPMLDREVGD